ncbi:hypothetical protein R3P38DRAFT_3576711, partial [Favolaschia claudopus]
MHWSLHPDILRRLPANIRTVAESCLSSQCSPQNILRLRMYVASVPDQQYQQRRFILPALYAIVDPEKIPSPAIFDYDRDPPAIMRALLSLQTIYDLDFLPEAAPDLWAAVVPWAQCIDTYRHLVLQPYQEHRYAFGFLRFAHVAEHNADISRLMHATPWFWYMLSRAWAYLPDVTDPEDRESAIWILTHFLTFSTKQLAENGNFPAFLDGLDGSISACAKILVSYLDGIVTKQITAPRQSPLQLLASAFYMVEAIETAISIPESQMSLSAFRLDLIRHGMLPALTEALRALCEMTDGLTLNALTMQLTILYHFDRLFTGRYACTELPAAIDLGLLTTLILCATGPFATDLQSELTLYFGEWFPASLVDSKFLSSLRDALPEANKLVKSREFKNPTIGGLWRHFLPLAKQRIELFAKQRVGLAEKVRFGVCSLKGCDYLQCGQVGLKKRYQRCSGCRSFYYCSKPCQVADWCEGRHRDYCCHMGTFLLGDRNHGTLTANQRSFLRALLTHDYRKHKIVVLFKQTLFMRANPNQQFLRLYDYSGGTVKITVMSAADAPPELRGAELEDSFRRAAESDDRLTVDVIALKEPSGVRHLIVPFRTIWSALYKHLKLLA